MTTVIRILALTLLTSVALGATQARAQLLVEPEARQGYYIGGGLRFGVTSADSDVGAFGTQFYNGGLLRFGQKPLPWLGFGLSIGGGNQANDDWVVGYGGLMLEAEIEPFADLDLAIRLGAGAAGGGVDRKDDRLETDDDPSFAFGSMFSAGLVYEWFPFYDPKSYRSGGFGVGFVAEGRLFPGGDITAGGFFLGIETTWWTGLPKRKLDLPADLAF